MYNKGKESSMTWEAENSEEDKLPWPFSHLEMGTGGQNKQAVEVYCCRVSAQSRKTEVVEQ